MVLVDAGQLGRQRCASGQLTWRSVDDWRGRQMFEFFFNGCDVGINSLIEQAGLGRIELLTATAELAKRLSTAISCVSWSILVWR